MSRRLALVIGNTEYLDPKLARLAAPGEDVNDLADVLRTPDVGGFDDVTTLVNQPAPAVRRAVARHFADKKPDDLVVLYFSGHGVRDDRGLLYLAVQDTEYDLLNATAVPAAFVTDEMDRSRSRRQVLILDCCHSGAFAHGAKGAPGMSVGTGAAFEGTGYGRVVLTATDSTQYAWEGDQLIGEAENSVFTHFVIEGLRTGQADADADGRITLDELYDYVYEHVVNQTPKQTPRKFTYNQQGEVVIARNPRPVTQPAELPPELRHALDSPFAGVREGAIRELDSLLRGGHPGLALAAREALRRLVDDDSRRVAGAASTALAAYEASRPPGVTPVSPAPKRPVTEPSPVPPAPEPAGQDELDRVARVWAERDLESRRQAEEMRQAQVEATGVRSSTPSLAPVGSTLEPLARRAAELAGPLWLPVAINAVGWGIGWVAGKYLGETVNALLDYGEKFAGAHMVSEFANWSLAYTVGGLALGLVLRLVRPTLQSKQPFAVALVWLASSLVGLGARYALEQQIDWIQALALGLAVVGALGAWGVGRVLAGAGVPLTPRALTVVMAGWVIALTVTVAIDAPLEWSTHPFILGALVGAVGGAVLFWQISRAEPHVR